MSSKNLQAAFYFFASGAAWIVSHQRHGLFRLSYGRFPLSKEINLEVVQDATADCDDIQNAVL